MTLTKFQVPDIGVRMGRPPLNVKETKVRLTDEQRERIEAIAGPNRMAAFIRDAIDAELDRRETEACQRTTSQTQKIRRVPIKAPGGIRR